MLPPSTPHGPSGTNTRTIARVRLVATHKRPRHRRSLAAADRAVERELLRFATHSKLFARFVDPETKLVKRNVAARCDRLRKGNRHRAVLFFCRVWQAPARPSGGVTVLYRSRRHHVVVTRYGGRRKV
jgi:hypothetical protein